MPEERRGGRIEKLWEAAVTEGIGHDSGVSWLRQHRAQRHVERAVDFSQARSVVQPLAMPKLPSCPDGWFPHLCIAVL